MSDTLPPQNAIENVMATLRDDHRWEAIYLLSDEGLLLASCGASELYPEDKLLELVFSLGETAKLLTGEPVQEVVIRGSHGRRVVYRHITAWQQPAVIVAVTWTRRGYQRALARLIQLIQSL